MWTFAVAAILLLASAIVGSEPSTMPGRITAIAIVIFAIGVISGGLMQMTFNRIKQESLADGDDHPIKYIVFGAVVIVAVLCVGHGFYTLMKEILPNTF